MSTFAFSDLRSSLEDLDPGEVEQGPEKAVTISPDPRTVEEVSNTFKELAADDQADNLDEAKSAVESLNAMVALVEADNAKGGLDAPSAALASIAVESLTDYIGLNWKQDHTSMESAIASLDGKQVVSLEALKASLEGVDAPFKEGLKRLGAAFRRTIEPNYLLVKASGHGLDDIIKDASSIRATGKATIEVKASKIAVGDSASKNVAADLIKAAEILSFLTVRFTKEAEDDFVFNDHLTQKLMGRVEEVSEFSATMKDLLGKWRDPRKKLGGDPTDPIIGNYQFFTDQSLKYTGKEPSAVAFDKLANLAYPKLVGYHESGRAGSSDASKLTIPALSPADIIKIGTALKHAVDEFSAWESLLNRGSFLTMTAGTVGVAAAAAATVLSGNLLAFGVWLTVYVAGFMKLAKRLEGQGEKKPGEGIMAEDIRTVYDAWATSSRLRFHVGYDAGVVLRKVNGLFKDLARASIKAWQQQASTEAMDDHTAVDGQSTCDDAPNDPTQSAAAKNLTPEEAVLPPKDGLLDGLQVIQNESVESLTLYAGRYAPPYWYRATRSLW